MKYVLGIPYVNRPDLLRLAVNSVQKLWPDAFIIDNSEYGEIHSNIKEWPVAVIRIVGVAPLSFSQSMNLVGHMALKRNCDWPSPPTKDASLL